MHEQEAHKFVHVVSPIPVRTIFCDKPPTVDLPLINPDMNSQKAPRPRLDLFTKRDPVIDMYKGDIDAKHIFVIDQDIFGPRLDEKYDAEALKVFKDEELCPQTPDDYLRIVKVVVEQTKPLNPLADKTLSLIKDRYTADTSSEAWDEFRELIDRCIANRKFRMIRRLGDSFSAFHDPKRYKTQLRRIDDFVPDYRGRPLDWAEWVLWKLMINIVDNNLN